MFAFLDRRLWQMVGAAFWVSLFIWEPGITGLCLLWMVLHSFREVREGRLT